jgi:hypothetical protein
MPKKTLSSLDLETLTAKYDSVLTKYEQAQADYINYIQSRAKNPNDDSLFGTIPNAQFISDTRLKTSSVATPELCQVACASELECSGATFTPSTGRCVLRSGKGNVSRHESTKAIVPKEMIYLSVLKRYNKILNKINQKLLNAASVQETSLKTRLSKTTTGSEELSHMYKKLLRERTKIEDSIAHISMSEINNDSRTSSDKVVTARHIWYIFTFSVLLLLIIIIMKTYASSIAQAYNSASYMAARAVE